MSLIIAWEIWDGKFNYPVVSSNGAAIPDVWLAEEGGKVIIFLKKPDKTFYYPRFTVRVFSLGLEELPEHFKGWTVVDEPNSSSKAILCTYKNNFKGNMGIGTETPQSMLDVRGKIIADEVEIKINKGADFVFSPDYNLKSLSEVEYFVKENKHLPDIPSEKEMQRNGLNLNDMQIKFLQKIEELTLYVIDLKKESEKQNSKIEELQAIIEQLQNEQK